MTTPAGWYDDGSGRQRWWDGQQWTEHFAPDQAAEQAAAEPLPEVPTEAEIEQTIAEADHADASAADATAADATEPGEAAPDASPSAVSDIPSYTAPETPAFAAPEPPSFSAPEPPAAPSYGSPAPSYGSSAPSYSAPASPGGYPGAAPAYPPAAPTGAYPAATGYGAPGAPGAYGAPTYPGAPVDEPRPMSILGLVGLGLAALGLILVCFSMTAIFGWIALLGGLVVSVISLFQRGKKWPGITGIGVSILGGIVGGIMAIVFFTLGFAQVVSDAASDYPSFPSDDYSTITPDDSDTDSDTDTFTGGRPTVDEVAVGVGNVIDQTGDAGFTDEQVTCIAQEFVNSDIPDETLWEIADSDGTFTSGDAAYEFGDKLVDATAVCMF